MITNYLLHQGKKRRRVVSLISSDVEDSDGMLVDVEVGDIAPSKLRNQDKTQDVQAFFGEPHVVEEKKKRDCLNCPYVFLPFVRRNRG